MTDPIDINSYRPTSDCETEFIGPFPEACTVACGGYRVPRLQAYKRGDGRIALVLDERFEITADEAEAARWVWFIANAMAIAGGYSCHGANAIPINPYRMQMIGVTGD